MTRFDRSPRGRLALAVVFFLPLLFLACEDSGDKRAQPKDDRRLTVQGELTRVAAIGGETTGWAIRLDQPIEIDGKEIRLLEVNSQVERWQQYEEKHVEAAGRVTYRQGIERGRWPVLAVESMRETPPPDS